jgi:hypothetical protein
MPEQTSEQHGQAEHLHIFVNRRKFEVGDGVKPEMTGAAIAALVQVPADSAVIRFDSGPDKREISVDEPIAIKSGQHFLVTRKVVEGGHEPRKN